MKKLILFASLVLSAALQYGCSTKEVGKQDTAEPVKLNRDTVSMLLRGTSFYVTEAWQIAGKDSVDMFKEDSLLREYANAAYINFFISKGKGQLMFHGGHPIPNTVMPGNALTFSLNIRIYLPMQMELKWDDEKGTLWVESYGTTSYLPMIVPAKKGYLDPASFLLYWSMDEAKNAVIKPSIKFIYENDDPKLGKVTYKVTLKPMYEYYRAPYQQNDANFVVF
jgi:hypothetical protein